MTKIPNPQIQELADALCDAETPPSRPHLQDAMRIAYICGRRDGALEVCERVLAETSKGIRAQEAEQAAVRG